MRSFQAAEASRRTPERMCPSRSECCSDASDASGSSSVCCGIRTAIPPGPEIARMALTHSVQADSVACRRPESV